MRFFPCRASHPGAPPPCGFRSPAAQFRDVAFTYPGSTTPTLRNVSFVIEPGETVALVGDNGAGKTTIAKLIARLHSPTKGAVLFDGVDAREMDVDHLRRQVTCLFPAIRSLFRKCGRQHCFR